jgi:RNA polymerase sigma-54 factor
MRMSFGQEMRLAQKQVLAPRMIQSMEILQLPVLALEERIEQEIQNNETLEVDEAGQDEGSAAEPSGADTAAEPAASSKTVDETPLVVDHEHANQADFERSYDWSAEYPDSDDDRSRPSAAQIDQAGDRYLDLMANMQERPETLCDHLHAQLASEDLTEPVVAEDRMRFVGVEAEIHQQRVVVRCRLQHGSEFYDGEASELDVGAGRARAAVAAA